MSPLNQKIESVPVATRLIIHAAIYAVLIYFVSHDHDYSRSLKYGAPIPLTAIYGWLLLQSLTVMTIPVLVGSFVAVFSQRAAIWTGKTLAVLVALIHCLAVCTFNIYCDRPLSQSTYRVVVELIPSLLQNLNETIVMQVCMATVIGACIIVASWKGSDLIAVRLQRPSLRIRYSYLLGIGLLFTVIASVMPMARKKETYLWMCQNPSRHPLLALGLVSLPDTGKFRLGGSDLVQSRSVASRFAPRIKEMLQRYENLPWQVKSEEKPDLLFVVIESFRPEALTPETTPNLNRIASKGIKLNKHYSTANSTNMSMFSMLYGLDSIWFERMRSERPAMLNALKAAGYETAFFGGCLDWAKFKMDSFINDSQFDVFQISEVKWTQSDTKMANDAAQFLESGIKGNGASDSQTRKPLAAFLYLYSSHFDYHSESPELAATGTKQERLSVGYLVDERDQVWQRYLQSVGWVDQLLGPLVSRDDRVVIVTGDHGESFLEDGCRIHGTRITKYQNMTPALIAGPGVTSRTIDFATSHTDFLKTILPLVGVESQQLGLIDGIDLQQTHTPPKRLVLTRNYLDTTVGLVQDNGPTQVSPSPFAWICQLSLDDWQAFGFNMVNESGLKSEVSDPLATAVPTANDILTQYVQNRFDSNVLAQEDKPHWQGDDCEANAKDQIANLTPVYLESLVR